ncbi:AraC family transcriptional regulator [Arenibacter sp. F20364]|uniref:helix-turn-helix domain-containing protein n=1 Tax=Arenibacter sp. F20364 TaxID=2926415 RepID=UPI001FF3763F|nr:AraC family transcriptional regulator [Arenibacter sp. F20364]MCK0189422.1 AraC family transcriptional regulator [Arenibacter sp. F20364]
MKKQFYNLRNYKEILAAMNLPVYAYIDSHDLAILKIHEMGIQVPFNSPTFRPNYYTVMIIKRGKGLFSAGNDIYELGPNHVIITRPDVYTSSYWTELDELYAIFFDRRFLEKYLPDGIDHISDKGKTNGLNCWYDDGTFLKFVQICLEMYDIANSGYPLKNELMANLIVNMLLLIEDHQNSMLADGQYHMYNPMVFAFRRNMEDNINKLALGEESMLMRTKEHADQLNLNISYLSKVVSKSTGKTINQWINEKLIGEIIYLLKNSDESITKIAEMFGFSDANYFSSFFKKQTDNSPSTFRSEYIDLN